MSDRRPITEDDLLLTEMLIAKSYGNLKRSVVRTSAETLSSLGGAVGGTVGGTIKRHPYATAGAAVGLGIILFGLFRLMNRGGPSQKRDEERRRHSSGMGMEILSMIAPLLMPYITEYIERSLGAALSRGRNRNT